MIDWTSFGQLHARVSARVVRALLLAAAVWSAAGHAAAQAQTERQNRPNVVVIVADDLGWNDVGYHNPEIRTPHLDRLASEGARLEQFYVYATCSPTRVALLTGRNPARFNVFGPLGSTTDVEPADMRLPFGLQGAGYSTHISGKWHIGDEPEHRPLRHGFTTSYGYFRGQIDPYTHRYKFGDYVTWHRNDRFLEEDGHVTELITDEAVRVIENASEVGQAPFFLYVAHHAPHYPHNTPPKWVDPYEEVFDEVWRRHTAAAITHMDHEIGRIIDALERTGQRDNTLIIFMSDNGGQRSWSAPESEYNGRYPAHSTLGDNSPLRGWKAELYEGGLRVPALANWPSVVPAGLRIDRPTHVLDWAPTLLQLVDAGADIPDDLDGRSLWSVLTGEQQESTLEGRRFYWRQGDICAVRDGDWKLIANEEGSELFHLAEDPYEEREMSNAQPEKREALLELLSQWPGHASH